MAVKRGPWWFISGASLPALSNTDLCLHLLWGNTFGFNQWKKRKSNWAKHCSSCCCLESCTAAQGGLARVAGIEPSAHTHEHAHAPSTPWTATKLHTTLHPASYVLTRALLTWHRCLQEREKIACLSLYVQGELNEIMKEKIRSFFSKLELKLFLKR